MKSKEGGGEILSLLEEKIPLFHRYLSVTENMKEAFGDDGKGNIGNFLSERQDVIQKINEIDSSIEKVMEGVPDQPTGGFGECRELIDTRLQDIRLVIETVDPIERELIIMVKGETESVKRSLLEMRNTRQAVNGYQKTGSSSPKFFDTLR